jgi:hypothetical protein
MSKESNYTIIIDQLAFIGVISGQSKDFNILQAKPECENTLIILLGDFLWSFFFFFFFTKESFHKTVFMQKVMYPATLYLYIQTFSFILNT